MTTFVFGSPDGRKYTVDGPDGSTQEQAFAVLRAQLAGPGVDQSGRSSSLPDSTSGTGPEPPSAIVRVGAGFNDVAKGLQGLYLRAKGLFDPNATAEREAMTAEQNDAEQRYQAGRAVQQQQVKQTFGDRGNVMPVIGALTGNPTDAAYLLQGGGPDVARLAGNAIATVPAMAALPAGAASVVGRVAQAAGIGGIQGGVQFDPTNSVAGKLKQVGVGAGAGAVGQGVGETAVAVAAPILAKLTQAVNMVKNRLTGATTPEAATAAVQQELKDGGIDWNSLPAATQDSVVADFAATLGAGKVPDAGALARKADFETLGVPYTEAQVTRDPRAWTAEQRVRKIEGVGDPLQTTLQNQNDELLGQLPAMRAGTGSQVGSGYEAAEAARQGVQGFKQQASTAAGDTYKAAEAAPGAEANFPAKDFFAQVDPILEKFEDKIPGPVKKRIEELRAGYESGGPVARQQVKPSVDTQNDDIVTAVRKLGGINPGDEAIGSLADAMAFPPHPNNGPVFRQPTFNQNGQTTAGHSLDRMAELLHGKGYISDRNALDDVTEKLYDSSTGVGQHFSEYRQPGFDDPMVQALDVLTKQLAQRSAPAKPAARDFTVGEASKLYQLINDTMGGEPGKTGYAGRLLNEALANTGAAAKGDAGEAMRLFKDATGQWRTMKTTLEPTPIKALADTNEAPVNFIETKVLGGKPGELASLRDVLNKQDSTAWDGIRASTLDWLMQQSGRRGTFNGGAFSDALDKIGMPRLKVLFSADELAKLGTIKRAGFNATVPPAMSAVNYSNTGSEIANLLANKGTGPGLMGRILGHVPGVGPALVGGYATGKEALAAGALRRAVQGAANPGAGTFATPPLDAEATRQALAKLLMKPAGIGGALYGTTSGP